MYFQGKKNTYFTMFFTAKRTVPERNPFRSDQHQLDWGFNQAIAAVFSFHFSREISNKTPDIFLSDFLEI